MDTTNQAPRPAADRPAGEVQGGQDDGATEGKLAMPDLLTLALWALLDRKERE